MGRIRYIGRLPREKSIQISSAALGLDQKLGGAIAMIVPHPSQRLTILDLLDDGRVVRRADLGVMGFSQGVIGRMLAAEELERVGTAGVRRPGIQHDPVADLAAAFGGKGGVLTLHAALRVHGLTNYGRDHVSDVVLLPFDAYRSTRGIEGVEVVRTRRPEAFSRGLEVLAFSGQCILVAKPARAVCDLFAPWAARFSLGREEPGEALMRLLALHGPRAVQEVEGHALALGWADRVSTAVGLALLADIHVREGSPYVSRP